MPEAGEGGGGEAEEAKREGGVGGERLHDLGSLGGGESEAVGAEVVIEVEKRGGGCRGAEDSGDGADEVAARQRVAARVKRGGGRRRRDGDGEGRARGGRRRRRDAAGVGRSQAAGHFGRRGLAFGGACTETSDKASTDSLTCRANWVSPKSGPACQ